MKKLNILLDDVTVINFSFLWRLFRRYWLLTAITPFLVAAFASYFYATQNIIYSVSLTFSNVGSEKDSPTGAIASLLGEKSSALTASEVIGLGRSSDFQHQLGRAIFNNANFPNMNFNGLRSKKKLTHRQIFGTCSGDEDCISGIITTVVGGFYEIVPHPDIENKFEVKVKTLDHLTSTVILDSIASIIHSNRLESIRHNLSEQRKISEELVKKKKEELEAIDVESIKTNVASLKGQLEAITSKLITYTNEYNTKKIALANADIKFKQSGETLGHDMNDNEMVLYKKVQSINENITKLRQDIYDLEIASPQHTPEDKAIIKQLNNELKKKRAEMFAIKDYKRYLRSYDDFLKGMEDTSDTTVFNLSVLREQVAKVKKDQDAMIMEKQLLIDKLSIAQGQLDKITPSFEYLKLLEGKMIQLRFIESTVVSDLVFDKHSSGVSKFKRTSLLNIIAFSTLMSGFLMFILVVTRYLLDGRIFDEFEMANNFHGMEVIGNTPKFK